MKKDIGTSIWRKVMHRAESIRGVLSFIDKNSAPLNEYQAIMWDEGHKLDDLTVDIIRNCRSKRGL